ncbi:hypothetical protein BMS3Abin04_00471 [bacterium BMS3Abin04]|nr:hypothetical protein BMS3Abin04_00471 [bacterium BMS3Abin04]
MDKLKIKRVFFICLFLLIASCSSVKQTGHAEVHDIMGSFPKKIVVKNKTHIPSEDVLKALFIFIQFDNDKNVKSKAWPYDTLSLPAWTKTFVNKEPSKNFPVKNISQYYYEMSDGKFFLTGDVYPELVRPFYSQKHYKSISEVNYEILKQLDGKIDFSQYDNWSRGRDGYFIRKPDKKVDMIYLIYRNFSNRLFFNNGWTGIAHLYLTKNIKTNDGVTIKTGSLDRGSGIIIRGGKNGAYWLKYVAAHELGHFLFGSGHIQGVTSLAVMTGGPVWNAGRGMHSWERARLGWIKYTDVKPGIDKVFTLPDYMTSGKALRLKLSGKEWFVVENREHLSVNDKSGDKGIYIYHINNADRYTPRIFVECADGNWDFKIDTKKNKLYKIKPNPNGKNEINFTRVINRKNYACFKPVYKDNSAWGDNTDAFDVKYNNVFSPVSNPSSGNNAKIPFTIEVVKKIGTDYRIKFYFKHPYEGKPSKPQYLRVKINTSEHPKLTWSVNKEPDLLYYKIYLGTGKKYNPVKLKLINKTNYLDKNKSEISWIDLTTKLSPKNKSYFYAVSAVDKGGKQSVISNPVKIYWKGKWVVDNAFEMK